MATGADRPQDPRIGQPSNDVRPVVMPPRSGLPAPLWLAIACILAVALFLYLDARRRSASRAEPGRVSAAINLPSGPPPLTLPPPPHTYAIQSNQPLSSNTPQSAIPRTVFLPAPVVRPLSPSQIGEDRVYVAAPLNRPSPEGSSHSGPEPAMVVDLTVGAGAQVNSGGATGAGASLAGLDGEGARASLIRNRAMIIPQGAIIAAVLETPLNSDQPGLARAIVSRDAHAFDGDRVLIPRGSRLIGDFKADSSPGLHRILVIWNRLIRPDGVAINIGSPVTSPLGQAGAGGRVNTHFFERFSSALLQSALTVGVELASSRAGSGSNGVYVVLPAQAAVLGQQLAPNVNRPPTVRVSEGAEIAVLVARDLDFGGTPPVK